MSKDGIDASLGLTFSLELFKRYRRSGTLRATLPRVPGIRGRCDAFLLLVNGDVSSAYLEDQKGQRYSSDVASLSRLDRDKGPFEWVLISQSAASDASQAPDQPFAPGQPESLIMPSSVPRIVTALDQGRLSSWTPQQRNALYAVLALINGERTVEHIKGVVPLPPDLVDELLRILLESDVIIISA